jgi:CheY-like chemotaxis protein
MNEPKMDPAETAKPSRGFIYVVDDEPMLLELATVILEPQGYRVKCFRDPELALESFDKASPRPDLLMTDFAMHGLNGMQLVEKFRRLNPGQKILLVSGTVGADIFRDSPEKPDLFLAKPYQAHQLTEAVGALMAGK